MILDDHLKLAGVLRPIISTPAATFEVRYKGDAFGRYCFPFPHHAQGFLYFHACPQEPEMAFQIRFRTTNSNSPASFKSGSDLLYPNHIPWHISLTDLGKCPRYLNGFRGLLQQDGLASEELLLRSTTVSRPGKRTHDIHSLGQPFEMNFQTRQPTFRFISADWRELTIRIGHSFFGTSKGSPYTGQSVSLSAPATH